MDKDSQKCTVRLQFTNIEALKLKYHLLVETLLKVTFDGLDY